jgi:hypothetical protein
VTPKVWVPPFLIRSRPTNWAIFSPSPNHIRLKNVPSRPLMRIPAWIFSQIRGTAKNSVGWISRRFSCTVSIDSAKLSTGPNPTLVHVEKIRSATWHSGRYVRIWSSGVGWMLPGHPIGCVDQVRGSR